MVTWGSDKVYSIPGNSPAPSMSGGAFAFSAPAPAGGGGAFSTPAPVAASAFGSSAPAPAVSFFGTPSPAPSGGMFGSTAGSGLFGSAPAAGAGSSGGGLFGSAPAPPAFGGFGQTGFGSAPQQQQQQAAQIPAQAAMQAHLDASARQEESRVMEKLEHIQRSYAGAEVPTQNSSANFATVLYNPLSREVHQQQWLQGIALDGRPRPVALPRPAQVSEHDWNQALVRNPDFMQYMPIPVVGAEALRARLNYQQELSNDCNAHLDAIDESQSTLRRRSHETHQQLEHLRRRQDMLKKKFLAVMRKVELARCFNLPLQRDEIEAMHQIAQLLQQVQQLYQTAKALSETIHLAPLSTDSGGQVNVVETEEERERNKELFPMVQQHRSELVGLYDAVKRDGRDLSLIQDRVEQLHPTRVLRG